MPRTRRYPPHRPKFSKQTISYVVRFANSIVMRHMTYVVTDAVCQSTRVFSLRNHPNLVTRHLALVPNRVINGLLNTQFAVSMGNCHDQPTTLLKETLVGIILTGSVAIIEIQAGVFPSDKEPVTNEDHEVNFGEQIKPNMENSITHL